jgi:hypothetical protein
VIAAPCPIAAYAAYVVDEPSRRSRTGTARLFASDEQASMCVRVRPGEGERE